MAKLYLIRRNLETFAGPMTLSEMKDAYRRMAFGLQDEVCGNCGTWVPFEDLTRIKKYYPEVARIVNEEMLASWGLSDHSAQYIANEETQKVGVKNTKGLLLAFTFLAIALAAFAAAIYMASANRFFGRNQANSPAIEEAQGFVDRKEFNEFHNYMANYMPDIVEKMGNTKRPAQEWLPYVRYYAFNHEGQVLGISQKLLRGTNAPSAPIDCSSKAWRMRWRSSIKQWSSFFAGRKLIRAHWARMLAWDPHWIRRRDNKGWLLTQNYYVGCLNMALTGLAEAETEEAAQSATPPDWEKLGLARVRQRLQFILDMARDGQSLVPTLVRSDDLMSAWTCFEAAKSSKDLLRCREGQASTEDAWQAYTDERYGWNWVRLAALQKGALPAELLTLVGSNSQKLSKGDHFTRFDYRAEYSFVRNLARPQVPVETILKDVDKEYPEVKLAH